MVIFDAYLKFLCVGVSGSCGCVYKHSKTNGALDVLWPPNGERWQPDVLKIDKH